MVIDFAFKKDDFRMPFYSFLFTMNVPTVHFVF